MLSHYTFGQSTNATHACCSLLTLNASKDHASGLTVLEANREAKTAGQVSTLTP